MAYDLVDFEKDVIQASRQKPVLVDFWAPWCGPCRMLSPVLEKLADAHQANWTLVKVNSDEQQELSARYGVRGIPNVKLFVDGLVVDEFTGALPEHAILEWLEKAIPSEAGKLVERARQELAAGESIRAQRVLEEALDMDQNHAEAKILLAKLRVLEQPQRASELLEGIEAPTPEAVQLTDAILLVSSVLSTEEHEQDLPDGPGKEPYLAALSCLRSRNYECAIAELLEVLLKDRYYAEDAARRVGLALFTLLGPEHPVSVAKRRMFDMYLY